MEQLFGTRTWQVWCGNGWVQVRLACRTSQWPAAAHTRTTMGISRVSIQLSNGSRQTHLTVKCMRLCSDTCDTAGDGVCQVSTPRQRH